MSLTVVVTRNVPPRYTGFLASVMLEVAPGVFVSPRLTRGIRERVWAVCLDWAGTLAQNGGLTLVWRDTSAPGGIAVRNIGSPKVDLVSIDGLWLQRRELTREQAAHVRSPEQR